MILLNITVIVDWSVHDPWLAWVKEEFITELMATGLFQKYQLVRLLQVDEMQGPTYAIQVYSNNMEDYNRFESLLSETIRRKALKKWGDKALEFRTVMQVLA
jgi:hypothetical protein